MSRRILLIRPTLPPEGAVGAPITPAEFALILLRRFVMRCATLHRPDAVVVIATPEALDRVAPPRTGLPPNRPVGLTWRAHLDGLKCPWTLVAPSGPVGEAHFPVPPPLGEPPFAYLEMEVPEELWNSQPLGSAPSRDSQGALGRSTAPCRVQLGDPWGTAFATPPRRHTLRLPEGVALVDRHIHTHFAYCACDMDPARVPPLARAFGLADFSLSEHSDQLYFTSEALANRDMMRRGLDLVVEARASGAAVETLTGADSQADSRRSDGGRLPGIAELHSAAGTSVPSATQGSQNVSALVAPRMDAWVRAVRDAGLSDDRLGFETECDLQGRPILLPEDAARAPRRIGAIHNLAVTLDLPRVTAAPRAAAGATLQTQPGYASAEARGEMSQAMLDAAERAGREFLRLLEPFAASGITTLAHPFRVFRRRGLVVPEWLFAPVADILARHGVAAEINFHSGNTPSVAFTRECLAHGVRLAFGSDAHELCEIGDFAPHLEHLKEAGHEGPPEDVLLA